MSNNFKRGGRCPEPVKKLRAPPDIKIISNQGYDRSSDIFIIQCPEMIIDVFGGL